MKLAPVRGDLLPKQDRNKHHCQGHLLQELRYQSTCVNGSTSNQESTTDTLLKFRRKWSECFDMIVLSFEKKTEQLNSKIRHRCLHHIRVFSAMVNSNMAEFFAQRWSQEEILVLLGSLLCREYSILSSKSRPFWRKSIESSIARQRVVTERLRRVHLPRWKLPRHALDYPVWIDSRWEKMSSKGDRRCSSKQWILRIHIYTNSGITTWRRPELQCPNSFGKYTRTQCRAKLRVCSEEGIDVLSNEIQRDHPSQHSPSGVYWEGGGNELRKSAV